MSGEKHTFLTVEVTKHYIIEYPTDADLTDEQVLERAKKDPELYEYFYPHRQGYADWEVRWPTDTDRVLQPWLFEEDQWRS